MGKMTPSSTKTSSREASNYVEVSMHQSLLFSDSLEDLKNLRTQLYSAAEFFELSYTNDDQKQIVVETLKDYAVKALVNTVDHLGSVTFKVNDLLDEKVDEVSGTELSVSCIEQRIRTCQEYIDHGGLTEQSLVINTPNYHKHYILPVGESLNVAIRTKSVCHGYSLHVGDDWHQFRNGFPATIRETPPSRLSEGRSPSPSPPPGTFTFSAPMPKRDSEKRSVSPYRFPLLRSRSHTSRSGPQNPSRPTTPNPSRPTTPILSNARRYPSEPRKSASTPLHAERENDKETEQHPSKSKRLLKALLGRRKSKKDDMLYSYLDEY